MTYWVPRPDSDFLDGRFEVLYVDDPSMLSVSGVTGVSLIDISQPAWHQVADLRGARSAAGGASITRALPDQTSLAQPTQVAASLANPDGRYTPGQPSSDLYGRFRTNTLMRLGVGEPYQGAGIAGEVEVVTFPAPSLVAARGGLLICAWLRNIFNPPADMSFGAATATAGLPLVQMRSAYLQVGPGPTGAKYATAAFNVQSVWASVSMLIYGGIPVLPVIFGTSDTGEITLTSPDATPGMWLVAVHGMFAPSGLQGEMVLAPVDEEGGWVPLADSGPVREPGNLSQLRGWARLVNRAGPQTVTVIQPLPGFASAHQLHLFLVQGLAPAGIPDAWSPRAVAALDAITQHGDPGAAVLDGLDPDTAARAGPGYDEPSHGEVYAEVTGQGILSLLSRGNVLESALTRAALLRTQPVAMLWPMETGSDATEMPGQTGLPNGLLTGAVPSLRVVGDQVRPGSVDGPPGAGRLPEVTAGAGGSRLQANLLPMLGLDPLSVTIWFKLPTLDDVQALAPAVPAANLGVAIEILTVNVTGGALSRIQIRSDSTAGVGTLAVQFTTTSGVVLQLDTPDPLLDGLWHEITVTAGSVFVNILAPELFLDGVSVDADFGNGPAGRPSAVNVARFSDILNAGVSQGIQIPIAVGQLGLWGFFEADPLYTVGALAYAGESAGRRLVRLCSEERIRLQMIGHPDDTQLMGSQTTLPLLALLRECEAVDGGILYEPREDYALAYRNLDQGLLNQLPVLNLLHGARGEVVIPLPATNDTSLLVNDVVVTRPGGGSAQATQLTGPMSVNPPDDPDDPGAGLWRSELSVNVESDGQLPDQAAWRVHLGTVDEPRYPQLGLDPAGLHEFDKDILAAAVAALDVGDRAKVTRLPLWLPPDRVDQMAIGFAERLEEYQWQIVANTRAYVPFAVGVLGAVTGVTGVGALDLELIGRLAADDTTLVDAVSAVDTSWRILPGGARWATNVENPDDFNPPFRVGCEGEIVLATAGVDDTNTLTAGAASHGDNTALTPALPGGLVDGDHPLCFAAIRNLLALVDDVPDWTRVGGVGNNLAIFRWNSDTAPTVAPTVTFIGGAAGDTTSAVVVNATGVSGAAFVRGDSNTSQQDMPVPVLDLLTPLVDRQVVLMCGWKQDDWTGATPPTGWTELVDSPTLVGNDQSIYVMYQVVAVRRMVGSGTIVVTGGAAAISATLTVTLPATQTLTVTRSYNTVVKTHPAGAPVEVVDAIEMAL